MHENFPAFIALVWPPDGGFDSPKQGYHTTPGDSGGGTYGGVTEATWQACVARGLVAGALSQASTDALQKVLEAVAWGPECDSLPAGLDVLIANGRMMTGAYPKLVQQCLGFIGTDVDGVIGPDTLGTISQRDRVTLIHAIHGRHYAYLSEQLAPDQWAEFGKGWTARLLAVHAAAIQLATPQG